MFKCNLAAVCKTCGERNQFIVEDGEYSDTTFPCAGCGVELHAVVRWKPQVIMLPISHIVPPPEPSALHLARAEIKELEKQVRCGHSPWPCNCGYRGGGCSGSVL